MALNLTPAEQKQISDRIANGELTANSEEVKILARKRFEDDPLLFAQHLLKEHVTDQATGEITKAASFHKEMMDLARANRFCAFAAPRGHAKSTTISFFYVLHQALYERRKNIVIISASEDMAKRFLRRLRDEMEYNPMIAWLFGVQKSDKWSETELRLNNKVVIHAKGRGAQLRGLIDGATRPDLIILDDIEDEELVRSELRRQDLSSWFNGSVLPTLAPKIGQCIFVGTVLHEDSLLNNLLNPERYPDFTQRKYKAINTDTTPPSALWPERQDIEALQHIKDSYIARYQLAQFYMEYQNDPMPPESATFRPEFFQFFEDIPHDANTITECYIDLGGGSIKQNADYTSMVVLKIDKHNTIFIDDYKNVRMGTDTKQIADAMFDIYARHQPRKFVIEKTVATNMVMHALTEEMLKRNIHLNIELISPTRGSGDRRGNMSDGKFQRIASMEAAFKLGVIKMRKWMTELQEQLLAFPRASHDDLVDALAYGYMNAQRRSQRTKQLRQPTNLYTPLYDELGI